MIGESFWFQLTNAANDIGDTLRSGLFGLLADFAFRARRQMFLGLLTKEEFRTGVISPQRLAEIKLRLGEWHAVPEFRSVAGSTSLIRAAQKYTEWATPGFQTAMQDLSNLISEARTRSGEGKKADLKKFMNSPYFRETMLTVLVGIGAYVFGQLIFDPDKDDRSFLGQLRRKAAREAGSIIQSVTGVGIFFNMRMLGMMQDLRDAAIALATLERYKTTGPGYEKGDLKGIQYLQRTLTPAAVRQFLPQKQKAKSSSSGGGGLDFGFGTTDIGVGGLDFGFQSIDFGI